jgi:outer membrane protein OmpA-like peptidoglycan-associated protein
MPSRRLSRVAKKRSNSARRTDTSAQPTSKGEAGPNPILDLQHQIGNARVARLLTRRSGDDDEHVSQRPDHDHSAGSTMLELQQTVGNAAVARMLAQRQPDNAGSFPSRPYPIHNGKVKVTPGAVLNVRGVQVQSLPFPGTAHEATFDAAKLSKGDSGSVQMLVNLEWDFRPADPAQDVVPFAPFGGALGPGGVVPDPMQEKLHGEAFVNVNVPFSVPAPDDKTKKPQIQWQAPRYISQQSNGKGAQLTIPVPITSDVTEDAGAVTINPALTIQEQLAFQAGTQGTSAATPVGISTASFGQQVQSQATDTGAYSESYTANVKLQPPEPTPAPVLTQMEAVKFGVNSAKVKKPRDIHEQYKLLAKDKDFKKDVESGKRTILVEGYASTTNTDEYNEDLSKRRAENVQKVLKNRVGSKASFDIRAYGEYDAKGEGELPEERRADITIQLPD